MRFFTMGSLARTVLLAATLSHATLGCGDLTEGGVVNVAYTPDGRLVAFATDETRIYDADARKQLGTVASPWAGAWVPFSARLILSGDGNTFAVGNGRAADVYDLQTGVLRAHIVVSEASEEWAPIAGIALSRDGTQVAVAVRPIAYSPPRLGVWRVSDGALVADLQQPSERKYWTWGAGLAFSPDGQGLFATETDENKRDGTPLATYVTAWNTLDGSPRWEIAIPIDPSNPGAGATANNLALSDDGTTLATAGGQLLRWDAATSALLSAFPSPSSPFGAGSLDFSPDGLDLLTTHGSNEFPDPQIFGPDGAVVREWDVGSGGGCEGAVFSPDGARVAAACGQWLKIWDVATGELVRNRKISASLY